MTYFIYTLLLFGYIDEVRPRIHPTYEQDLITMILIVALICGIKMLWIISSPVRFERWHREESTRVKRFYGRIIGKW